MEQIKFLVDFILHIDKYLDTIIQSYGMLTYGILFLIIFAETGFVVTPFLPGDSLLFAVGAFAARGSLDPMIISVLLIVAAILGDTVNYWIGHYFRPKIESGETIKFLNKKHLEKTHEFYEKYGGKTIIIGRFIPIVRTFAPFVAGLGAMDYSKFILYNVVGGIIWILIFVIGGYFFGNLPLVRKNFTLVIFAIIIISILPGVIEYLKYKFSKK